METKTAISYEEEGYLPICECETKSSHLVPCWASTGDGRLPVVGGTNSTDLHIPWLTWASVSGAYSSHLLPRRKTLLASGDYPLLFESGTNSTDLHDPWLNWACGDEIQQSFGSKMSNCHLLLVPLWKSCADDPLAFVSGVCEHLSPAP